MLPEAPHPGGGFPKSSFFYQVCRTAKKAIFFWGGAPLAYWIDLSKQRNVFIYF
jgi:hypothetical protein